MSGENIWHSVEEGRGRSGDVTRARKGSNTLHPSCRLARVAELRKALYKGYEPAEPEPIKKEADLEAGKPEEPVEDEMTANFQRK